MIYWPREFPCWLLENHEGQDEDIYARTEMDIGPARLRRKFRAVPHVRKAEIFLYGAEPAAFHQFFEDSIDRGARRFVAPFMAREGGIRYYECEFVKPYEAEFVLLSDARRAWRIKCEFRLHGDGKLESGELVAARLSSVFEIRLKGTSSIRSVTVLDTEFGINLNASCGGVRLETEVGISLTARVSSENELPGAVYMIALSGGAG